MTSNLSRTLGAAALLAALSCGAPPSPRDLGIEPFASFRVTFDS